MFGLRWRRRIKDEKKKILHAGVEWDEDDPCIKLIFSCLPKERPHENSNSLVYGCYRVSCCPSCGLEIFSAINEECTCSCGQRLFIDYDGVVTKLEGEIDYHATPDVIAKYLLPGEIEMREHQMACDMHTISERVAATSIRPIERDLQTSIRKALEIRNEKKRKDISNSDKDKDEWFVLIGVLIVLIFITCCLCHKPNLWVAAIVICVLAGLLRNVNSGRKKFVESWNVDDKRIDGLMRELYMHEANRLRDNMMAQARWEERERKRNEALKNLEQKRQKEQVRLRKQLETDEGAVRAICLGLVGFSEFIREVSKGDGHGYEKRVKRFVELCGFSCERVSDGMDQGVDLIVRDGDMSVAIQCKYYSDINAGNDAVQQVYAGAKYYSCGLCAVLTNNGFTKSAQELAKRVGVRLVRQDKIVQFLRELPNGRENLEKMTRCEAMSVDVSGQSSRTSIGPDPMEATL